MPRTNSTKQPKAKSARTNPFQLRKSEKTTRAADAKVHVFGRGVICDTDTRGHGSPQGRSRLEIVVDASEGFIPLWARDITLRWRFQERSLDFFANPATAKTAIKELLGDALLAWGDASPVKFAQREDAWDFEIAIRDADRCTPNGCVLASAFFPDAGRHELRLYPKMFSQSREEQVETFIHELGHAFGLRHFFADVSEREWPAHVFGTHKPFSIMNYGNQSSLTPEDKADLQRMYQMVWRGELTQINGTPIRLMNPFHTTGAPPEQMVAVGQFQPALQPQPSAGFNSGT